MHSGLEFRSVKDQCMFMNFESPSSRQYSARGVAKPFGSRETVGVTCDELGIGIDDDIGVIPDEPGLNE